MIYEVKGDLVAYWNHGDRSIGITTNGTVKNNGRAVMGAGIAKQIRDLVPDFDLELGAYLTKNGNHPTNFKNHNIYTFPVKHNWWDQADIDLILESAEVLNTHAPWEIHIPRPGCGNGRLNWEDVKPELNKVFSHNRHVFVWDYA